MVSHLCRLAAGVEVSFAKDYIDVAERLRILREEYPNASLQGSYEIIEVAGQTKVVYRAECYRDEEDPRPGVGYAWEDIPGTTNFTRGSELMNAETSAWGRAIVAALAAETKRVASADEVRNRNAGRPSDGGRRQEPAGNRGEENATGPSAPRGTSTRTSAPTSQRETRSPAQSHAGSPDGPSLDIPTSSPPSDTAPPGSEGASGELFDRPSPNQIAKTLARAQSVTNQNLLAQREKEWNLPSPRKCSVKQLGLYNEMLDTLTPPMVEAS